MMDTQPPPTYSQEDPTTLASGTPQNGSHPSHGPQILILPTVDAINFQSGYLGAEGERAAVEGEVQVKDIDQRQWSKLTISLRTYESAYRQEIELNSNQIILYTQEAGVPFPSSFPFSIPLPPDTPQSLQTPHSSLAHTLTASLHPVDSLCSIMSRRVPVYTRRYMPYAHTLSISPQVYVLNEPTRVEVQISQTSFKVGDPIPVYITIPPPSREIVVDKGLRLRNARIELIRVVKVKREVTEDTGFGSDPDINDPSAAVEAHVGSSSDIIGTSNVGVRVQSASPEATSSALIVGSAYRTVIARSGAACRFHSSRSIQLRLVLYWSSTTRSPTVAQTSLPGIEYPEIGSDADTASISQVTLLHAVTFYLHAQISFLDTKHQTERISTIEIPIRILPPSARLPQISHTLDEAYSKKHDRPPVKTNRYDDSERAAPHYSEGEAGPSILPGAPPPFEEPDAPPPFSSSAAEASTSARLPTFLESEREILMPDSSFAFLNAPDPLSPIIEGEGSRFGFHAADQFDGHSEELQRLMTPPPSMEMAAEDANLTALTESQESAEAIGVMTLVLERHEASMIQEQPPPPPPPMDDPSDPPPSIDDSAFRRPDGLEGVSPSHSPPPPIPVYHEEPPSLLPSLPDGMPSPRDVQTTPGHAPPPYLIPDTHHDQENVIRPPPYVD